MRTSTLQSLVQFVLQCRSLLRRGQNASIHAVLLSMAIIGEKDQLYLIRRGRHADLRLVAKPAAGCKQDKNQDEYYSDVILPGSAFVRPEKSLGENPLKAGHISPPGCHRRSRRRACARRGQNG